MSDYTVFSDPNFDANEYANTVLAGESYAPSSDNKQPQKQPSTSRIGGSEIVDKEDISVAISKLTFGIDDVSKQIKSVVTTHHEDLLAQAANSDGLSGSLSSVRVGLSELDTSLDKLRSRISLPYQSLRTDVVRLQKLQETTDLLRRASRFVVLARRLQSQMAEMDSGPDSNNAPEVNGALDVSNANRSGLTQDIEDDKERAIARAALSIAELVSLLDGQNLEELSPGGRVQGLKPDEPLHEPNEGNPQAPSHLPLRSISAVSAHVHFIEESRTRVTSEMENMVLTGLSSLNQSLLASSLQTAYNLRVLPELVQSLLLDLAQAVEDRIRSAFDLSKISKDVLAKDPAASSPQSTSLYRSRVRTEPTNVTAPQYASALWTRLESMIEEMADCCIKVYTLEKVLKIKKDPTTQAAFLEEAMKVLENKPSASFWTSLSQALEKQARDSTKNSSFLLQTLSSGYPRLLRLFHEFFAKIAVHTDTVYVQTHQSPETVVVLRAFSNFESMYLSRSSNKLNEAVGQAFTGGARTPPGMNEAVNIARIVTNELDSARFDPLLIRSVAKNVSTSLELMLSRADALVVRDRSAVTLIGPSATASQITNGAIATFLYHCWLRLQNLSSEHTETIYNIIRTNVQNAHAAFESIVDPLLGTIRRELGAIIAKLHRIDFAKPVDPMSGMGGNSSFYMKDLVEKLLYIKTEIFSRFGAPEASRDWTLSVVQYVIRTFVLHISIAKPLGESGKLQLTSDMTELEFALNAFMLEEGQSKQGANLESKLGDDYRALRAMRPLLFLDNAQLASPSQTEGLPPLIVLHHILVRSTIPLPHSLHGWQEAEYVRWVNEHSEGEGWALVESGLSHWEQINKSEGKDPGGAIEYVQLARTVLKNSNVD